jgi:gluconolactonase
MILLQQPEIRQLALFSAMPAEFRRTGIRSSWADINQGGRLGRSWANGTASRTA